MLSPFLTPWRDARRPYIPPRNSPPDVLSVVHPTYRICLFRLPPVTDLVCSVHSRRLEDRIRDLCAKAVTTEGAELGATLQELRVALREHADRLRKLAVQKPRPNRRG